MARGGDFYERQAAAYGLDEDVYRQQEMERRRDEQDRNRRTGALNRSAVNQALPGRTSDITKERAAAANRQAPTSAAASINRNQLERVNGVQANENRIRAADQFAAQQRSNINMLQQAAEGRGPSLTQEVLRQGQEDAAKRAQAQALASRGGPGALQTARNVAMAQSDAGAAAARNAGALGLQEQMAARGMLVGATENAAQLDAALRGQDIGLQTTQAQLDLQQKLANQGYTNQALGQNAGFQQQTNLANQSAALQNQAQMDAYRNQLLSMNMTAEENQAQRNLAAQQAAEEMAMRDAQQTQGIAGARQTQEDVNYGPLGAALPQAIGSGLAAGGTVLASAVQASDRRVKQGIQSADDELDSMFRKLNAYGYNYKDGMGLPQTRQVGLMAQDLEKSPIGDQAVIDGSDGVKRVDYVKLLPAMMAQLSELTKRVDGKKKS